ncbi:MAG TPA: FGGY family carbohydrate kinase [Galbitalea sp.]
MSSRPSGYLGIDIGTSSSKGVVVDERGRIVARATREHTVSRPRPGFVEMPMAVWWSEFVAIARELLQQTSLGIAAIGVSGMGPCTGLADADGVPLRPAILYGVDTRATAEIDELNDQLGRGAILARSGSALSSQAVGPKLAWLAHNEPDTFARARRLFMPASWLVWNLTGEYVLDHQSASQSVPLYDTDALDWYSPWADSIRGQIELPRLVWSNDIVGTLTPDAAAATGLAAGIPVIGGTIDAWTEAVSVGAQSPGDLMLMYGTTMFLINTVRTKVTIPELWGTVGAFRGTRNLAGGMATSGAITDWLRNMFGGTPYPELLSEAAESPAGARGLLMLPYFAGERTPISDPDARGIIAGLTVEHTRGDLYRAALEATAFGVRHNVETIVGAGGEVERVVAVGGGTQSDLWLQIVSDVSGLTQSVPTVTVGASYGAAFLAAAATTDAEIEVWNPPGRTIRPDPRNRELYDGLFPLYRGLYDSTTDVTHRLAELQRSGRT